MSGKHGFTIHLIRFTLVMLAMGLAGCILDEPYDTELRAQRSSAADSDGVRDIQAVPEGMSPLHKRLLTMTDIAGHERDTYDALLRVTRLGVAPSLDGLHAARAVCYSALTGTTQRSIIMVPLPSYTADLDATCHFTINPTWHAGGVAKPQFYWQDCDVSLDNTLYGGGYTSYVSEAYFEGHRDFYQACGPSNAVICCSRQFPD